MSFIKKDFKLSLVTIFCSLSLQILAVYLTSSLFQNSAWIPNSEEKRRLFHSKIIQFEAPLLYDQNFYGGKGWWMGRGVAVKGA